MKRDAFEQLAMESLTGEVVADIRPEASREQVAKIASTLLAQHRRFVRLVKQQAVRFETVYRHNNEAFAKGHAVAIADLLAALKRKP